MAQHCYLANLMRLNNITYASSDAAVTWQTKRPSVPLFVIDEVDDTVDGGKDLRYEL